MKSRTSLPWTAEDVLEDVLFKDDKFETPSLMVVELDSGLRIIKDEEMLFNFFTCFMDA
jgi:hypothetical protein